MLDVQLKVFNTIFLRSIDSTITSNIDCRWNDPCTCPLTFVDGDRNMYYVHICLFARIFIYICWMGRYKFTRKYFYIA